MFVTSLKWRFDSDAVQATPRTQGVFGLWDEGELVYLGTTERSACLPEALGELLKLKQQGSIEASHFTWEMTITPRSWAGELLRLYFNNHGSLPRYNRGGSPIGHESQVQRNFA